MVFDERLERAQHIQRGVSQPRYRQMSPCKCPFTPSPNRLIILLENKQFLSLSLIFPTSSRRPFQG